jgi:hypothetical protein
MTEALQVLCARFVQSLGRAAEAEYFSDHDAWATVEELAEMAAKGEGLGANALGALHNLGSALGLRPGAPASRYLGALERYFGPCPLKRADRAKVITYVHGQMNGVFAPKKVEKVSLSPADPVGHHVPLKNYEYK